MHAVLGPLSQLASFAIEDHVRATSFAIAAIHWPMRAGRWGTDVGIILPEHCLILKQSDLRFRPHVLTQRSSSPPPHPRGLPRFHGPPSNAKRIVSCRSEEVYAQKHRRRRAPRHDHTMSGNMHKQAGDVVRLRCITRMHVHRSALKPARPTCAGSVPNRGKGTKQRTILQIKRRGRGSLHAAGDHITRFAGVPPR